MRATPISILNSVQGIEVGGLGTTYGATIRNVHGVDDPDCPDTISILRCKADLQAGQRAVHVSLPAHLTDSL